MTNPPNPLLFSNSISVGLCVGVRVSAHVCLHVCPSVHIVSSRAEHSLSIYHDIKTNHLASLTLAAGHVLSPRIPCICGFVSLHVASLSAGHQRVCLCVSAPPPSVCSLGKL